MQPELATEVEPPPGPERLTPERLAETYAPVVYRFSAMVCRDRSQSEDLAQDALLRAMRALDQFDAARGTVDAWLWRIVVNLARDSGRAAGRWALAWERLTARGMAEPWVEPVESLVMHRLRNEELLEAVRALPRRHRTLVGLRFGAGLSYAEIGEQFGQNPEAVKQATYRALANLRKHLEGTAR
jgi:RNA polymerase sigma-70 factor (ECF subfamily)